MSKEKAIFIQNKGMYDLTVSAVRTENADDGQGGTYKRRVEYLTKTFSIRREDSATGRLLSTGFTMLSEAEYKSLEKDCKFFVSDIKSGNLVKFDEAPQEALLDTELISSLQSENAALKAEIEEKKNLLVNAAPELKKLEEKNAALETEKTELTEKNVALAGEVERLTKELDAMSGKGI